MIKAIFFATFDITEGPKLHHLLPDPLPTTPALIDFRTLAPYLVPPPALCNAPLTLLTPTTHRRQPAYRVLSHPICIESEDYPRNAFTFNFGLVLDAETEFSSYLPVVKKLATLFRGLEEQGRFLSKDIAASTAAAVPPAATGEDEEGEEHNSAGCSEAEADQSPNGLKKTKLRGGTSSSSSDTSKIYALSEILLEDLNNYGETQIPLDEANTLNLKLFPTYPPPPPLYAWHVPLPTVPLATLLETSSTGSGSGGDLTLALILPHLNGTNSLKRISQLADADFKLVRKAVRHLLYYGCCILLDIFSFGAIYAPTSTIAAFIEDEECWEECARYVALPFPPSSSSAGGAPRSSGNPENEKDKDNDSSSITSSHLPHLYLSLRQGLTVKAWCTEHPSLIAQLDIRRFITFGVIKGFLYRVHKYAIATFSSATTTASIAKGTRAGKDKGKGGRDSGSEGTGPAGKADKMLEGFLDGTHCFDEICTEMGISERELVGRLKGRGGEVQVICR